MENEVRETITAVLAHRTKRDSDANHIAEIAISLCGEIQGALRPVVGDRGVAALFTRAVYLTSLTHDWFGLAHKSIGTDFELDSWKLVIAGRSRQEVFASASDFFKSFQELLDSLIGASLTERLLRPLWASIQIGSSEEDAHE